MAGGPVVHPAGVRGVGRRAAAEENKAARGAGSSREEAALRRGAPSSPLR